MSNSTLFFIKQSLDRFEEIGSVFPTSHWAAGALSAPLDQLSRGSRRILELGSGTGSVTCEILKKMRSGDELCLCEVNPEFIRTLKKDIRKMHGYEEHQDRISFFEGYAQELSPSSTFDVIICALPFLNFSVKVCEEIFSKLEEISSPNATMTYYQFVGMKRLAKMLSSQRRRRLRGVESFFRERIDPLRVNKTEVWLNLFPIHVYTLDFSRLGATKTPSFQEVVGAY